MCIHSESISPVAIKMSVLMTWGKMFAFTLLVIFISLSFRFYFVYIFKCHNILE